MTETKLINRDPEILGGTAVFNGTRVPVRTLLDYLAAGDTLEAFLDHSRPSPAIKPLHCWNAHGI